MDKYIDGLAAMGLSSQERNIAIAEFDAMVAKLCDEGDDAAMKNVALAHFDLEKELTAKGTFCIVDEVMLDLSIHSDAVLFIRGRVSKTTLMTPAVMAQLADAVTCAAEIVQAEMGYTGPIKSKDLAEIESAIHLLAWAFHELFKAPA